MVTNQIRKDTIAANGKRINEAKNEGEMWKIVNNITNPNADETTWKLKEGDKNTVDEKEVADIFNQHFIKKISKLKENIDKSNLKDPEEILKKFVSKKKLHFELKEVTVNKVKKAMKSMKKKKSCGHDEISQECLLLGSQNLAGPLTKLINQSISTGIVPDSWKEAVVSPILKKGNKHDKANYRPVSCLVTASKVLEKIVCLQITQFIEANSLLPKGQHGFRAKHSTMTAHVNMQKDWTNNFFSSFKNIGLPFTDKKRKYSMIFIQCYYLSSKFITSV